MTLEFEKWHGIGNDFVIIDGEPLGDGCDLAELAREMCARTFGVGADGLLLALPSQKAEIRMAMYNPDGSEAEMCGNGIRCFARWHEVRSGASKLTVETGAGILRTHIDGELVRVGMGSARRLDSPTRVEVAGRSFTALGVDLGNPHLVVQVSADDPVDVAEWGRALESHPDFPSRVNVHFADPVGPNRVRQRTWERGAGETLACGTGACAVAVAAQAWGWSGDSATVDLPGGTLQIELTGEEVTMIGPAVRSFTGSWRGRRGGWPDEL